MKRFVLDLIIVSITLIYLLLPAITDAENSTKKWIGVDTPIESPPVDVKIISSNSEKTTIRFSFSGADLIKSVSDEGWEVEIPNEGHTDISGRPSLPIVSRLIAIPPAVKVTCNYTVENSLIYDSLTVCMVRGENNNSVSQTFNSDHPFPADIVELGNPALWGGLRVVRITVNPIQYDPSTETLLFHSEMVVSLKYQPGGEKNISLREPANIPRSYLDLYAQKIINFDDLNLVDSGTWGTNLIITPNMPSILPIVQTLADWKNRKGIPTVIATLDETGNTAEQIILYLQDFYADSDPQLAYVTLIGDCAGSIAVPPSNDWGDHDYTRLDGDDILADIAVGRYSCANSTQLTTEVNKVITYESAPYMLETSWYKKGAVVAGHASSGLSTIQTKRGVRVKALLNDYTEVDTLWYDMAGSVPSFTTNVINAGVGFYNFRGYVGMNGFSNSNIAALTNYGKLPFVVTITCSTGDITTSGSAVIEEFFRVGTPNNFMGAIAAVGTATGATHTRQNNCIDNGIFGAFFDYGIYEFGSALINGKLDLYLSYPDNPTSVENFCEWNNLIGDPSCQLWTDIPAQMLVDCPLTIGIGTASLEIVVIDQHSGDPLPDTDVCLYGDSLFAFLLTDENGEALFPLPAELPSDFHVTCCKHNYIPFLSEVTVAAAEVFVSYSQIEVDDDNLGLSSGNDDGNINPGEVVELGISLKNFGDLTTATNVTTFLNTPETMITLLDSAQTFPDLSPGEESQVVSSFTFELSPYAHNQQILPFTLQVLSDQGNWDSYLPLTVQAPEIVYQNHTVPDSNGVLDPGEAAELEISLFNNGTLAGLSLTGILYCDNDFIDITQPQSYYGNLQTGQSSSGSNYQINVSPDMVTGVLVPFEICITGEDDFRDTTNFTLQIGIVTDSDPSGPDDYGYYALDNSDMEYIGCPEYNWIEIDPNEPAQQFEGVLIPLDDYGYQQDDTELELLPFEFTYYGESFDRIAVCSNGWLAMGDQSYYTNFRNWYIPSTLGPYSLVAPFWDDLILEFNPPKRVYKYYDETGHRFIVEWNAINYGPGNYPEKFQVILLDPDYYPTSTGDGSIVFQYETVYNVFGQSSDNHFATVGIKSPDDLMGLQYSYWNHYDPGAAVLEAGRTIKFTTDPPVRISTAVIDELIISVIGNDVRLTWNDLPQAQIYRIYKSDQPYFTISAMTPADSTTINEYYDEDALSESPAFYRITWEY
ncbi:MAG: hypothetical protein H8E46_11345 [FCB group bacterium]|nr:hypothetical protein [FCB group bacterium]